MRMPDPSKYTQAFIADPIVAYNSALAQARKDALPFEDQKRVEDVLIMHLVQNDKYNGEDDMMKDGKLYSSLSWEVEELHLCGSACLSPCSDSGMYCANPTKHLLRIVTKP